MRWLFCENADELLFTGNNTNKQKLHDAENETAFVKDGINEFVVRGNTEAVNPARQGTKAAANYFLTVPAGERVTLRLSDQDPEKLKDAFKNFDKIFKDRKKEADEFYSEIIPKTRKRLLNLVFFRVS